MCLGLYHSHMVFIARFSLLIIIFTCKKMLVKLVKATRACVCVIPATAFFISSDQNTIIRDGNCRLLCSQSPLLSGTSPTPQLTTL